MKTFNYNHYIEMNGSNYTVNYISQVIFSPTDIHARFVISDVNVILTIDFISFCCS